MAIDTHDPLIQLHSHLDATLPQIQAILGDAETLPYSAPIRDGIERGVRVLDRARQRASQARSDESRTAQFQSQEVAQAIEDAQTDADQEFGAVEQAINALEERLQTQATPAYSADAASEGLLRSEIERLVDHAADRQQMVLQLSGEAPYAGILAGPYGQTLLRSVGADRATAESLHGAMVAKARALASESGSGRQKAAASALERGIPVARNALTTGRAAVRMGLDRLRRGA